MLHVHFVWEAYLFSHVPADMEVTEKEWRQVEEQVERLLSGQGSEVTACDVGLEQSKPANLRKTVTYIVCAIIFNEKVTSLSIYLPIICIII